MTQLSKNGFSNRLYKACHDYLKETDPDKLALLRRMIELELGITRNRKPGRPIRERLEALEK